VLSQLTISNAQNEANIWYFGSYAGLDFNSGQPIVVDGLFHAYRSSASICDSSGNFLFATNGEKIWNKNKDIMFNGDNLKGHHHNSQGSLIVKQPGDHNIYYVFVTGYAEGPSADYGFYYSIVDMNLDNGLGGVTEEKNILIEDAWDAVDKIVSVRQRDTENIWVITRKITEDGYASFLLSKNGINTDMVFSPSIDRSFAALEGNVKISQNKKYFVAAYRTEVGNNSNPDIEICKFNSSTGEIDCIYVLRNYDDDGCDQFEPWGLEFSPDSKYLYASYLSECSKKNKDQDNPIPLFQYDMEFIEDSAQFYDSRILIKKEGPGIGLQLARDGKIYCSSDDYGTYEYVSIIHKPWVRGTGCNYEADAIDLQGGMVGSFFPNTLTDHLFRFEWEGRCSSEPFVFQHNFIPEPKLIRWSFSDPDSGADSISFDLNPVHYFTRGGEYEVKVVVEYDYGRVERTSRVVTVIDSPHPNLGPDTLMCEQGEIVLNAGEEVGIYVWSDGTFGENANEIIVSDTGWYWVLVTNDENCSERDSIYVGLYPKPEINEDNLVIIPTSCGSSTGEISGLEIEGIEPLTFEWYDADSLLMGTEINLVDLTVGNYFLHIYDGNGCTTISDAYTIFDTGDIEVTQVLKENAHCNQPIGSLKISVNIENTEQLQYSIDNGSTWQIGDSIFNNLSSGNYVIRVKDQSGCEGVFLDNPVTIENIDGPEVTNVSTSDEIDHLSNGQINITANIPGGQIHYSINNGTSFQTDNGLFNNLSAGTYYCVVKDDFGCDTTFTVVLERTISQLIEAIAGDGNTCIGNSVVVPIKVNNFTDILKFHVKLTYDTTILSCDGYIKVHPDLENNLLASIIPNSDEVIVTWEEEPTTLEENATILELVFGAKEEGLSGIDWAANPEESAFYNENLEQVNTEFHVGKLRVYTQPEIFMSQTLKICEGGEITTYPFVSGGSGYVHYEWFGPNNFYSTNERITLTTIQLDQAGIYTLKVTDTIDCVAENDVDIIVYENPQIAFHDYDTLFVEPNFILEAGSGYESYLWSTGDTTGAIYINTEGLYSVYVTSTEQCNASDSVTILWGGEPFWLPNAFSPNGDGLNDEFKPIERYDYLHSYYLSIYNRWGQLIFETNNISEGWDGTYKGQLAPDGTYIYRIVYKAYSTGEETQTKTGQVTLVR